MEHYADKLQREIDEIKTAFPGIDKMIEAVKKSQSLSNFDIDYEVERDWRAYTQVAEILKISFQPLVRLSLRNLDMLDNWFENGLIPEMTAIIKSSGYDPDSNDILTQAKDILNKLREQ